MKNPKLFAEVGDKYPPAPDWVSDPYSYASWEDTRMENMFYVVNLPVNGVLSFKIFAETEEEAIRKGEAFLEARYVKEGEE